MHEQRRYIVAEIDRSQPVLSSIVPAAVELRGKTDEVQAVAVLMVVFDVVAGLCSELGVRVENCRVSVRGDRPVSAGQFEEDARAVMLATKNGESREAQSRERDRRAGGVCLADFDGLLPQSPCVWSLTLSRTDAPIVVERGGDLFAERWFGCVSESWHPD